MTTTCERPGSPYLVVDKIKKKEDGVNLRESVTPDQIMSRPRASKRICRSHGQEYVFRRSDLTWGCRDCEAGRVAFSKWYKDTYSLGYLSTHEFSGGKRSAVSQEVVISADERYGSIALMVQRSVTGESNPVYVTDLGDIAVDLAVRRLPGEDKVRRLQLAELYGVSQNKEETEPEPADEKESLVSRLSKY